MQFHTRALALLSAGATVFSASNAKLPHRDIFYTPGLGLTAPLAPKEPQKASTDPLSKEELTQVLDCLKEVLRGADSAGGVVGHARKNHVEVNLFDFRTDPLRTFLDGNTLAKNAPAAEAALARVDVDIVPMFQLVAELADKKMPRELILAVVVRAYASALLHELGHHEVSTAVCENFPKVKVMTHCTEHEGIQLAREAIFLDEATRKDLKIGKGGERFTVAALRGDASTNYRHYFGEREAALLKAAKEGRESFKKLVSNAMPIPYSGAHAAGQLRGLMKELKTLTLSPEQAGNLLTEEQKKKLIAAVEDTIKAYEEDEKLGDAVGVFMRARYESELDKLGKVFGW